MTATLNLDRHRPLADLLARGDQVEAMQHQARAVGGCEHPIRLVGHADRLDRVTGEVERIWSTEALPDGVQHVACKNRRASRCEPCSKLYQDDAFQLIAAGLRGGKIVPDAVAAHPAVFATFTAPTFGPVHTTRTRRGKPAACRPHSREGVCEHGVAMACWVKHSDADPLLGQALCHDCYDHAGAVLWNATASELWRRTIIATYRQLARLTGTTEKRLRAMVRVQYVKVAEYQRRGLVHFHAVIRLDAAPDPTRCWPHGVPWTPAHRHSPPPAEFTADLLTAALRAAAAQAHAPYPAATSPSVDVDQLDPATLGDLDAAGSGPLPAVDVTPRADAAVWGGQLDVRTVVAHDVHTTASATRIGRGQVAGYLAKYATKHTEALGPLDRRLRVDDLDLVAVNPHIHRLILTSWQLAHRHPSDGETRRDPRLQRWAHQLGYGGHFLTKSRRYSTTFGQLRAARATWQHRHTRTATAAMDPWKRLAATATHHITTHWQITGSGWRLAGDALLAATARRHARHARDAARDARPDRELARALAA